MYKKSKEQIKLEDMIELAEIRIDFQETIVEKLKHLIDNIEQSEITDDEYMKLYYEIKDMTEDIETNYIHLTGLKHALSIFDWQYSYVGGRDIVEQSHLYLLSV